MPWDHLHPYNSMEINGNPWTCMDIKKNPKNPLASMRSMIATCWNRVKISLGSTAWPVWGVSTHAMRSPKSMEFHENSWNSLKINEDAENLCKSVKSVRIDESMKSMIAASWSRVKVSLGRTAWTLWGVGTHALRSHKSRKCHENSWKSMRIHEHAENPRASMNRWNRW